MLQQLAQKLHAFGHAVTVLTGFPNYPAGTLYPGYRVRFCQREMLAGVPVVRVPLYPEHSRSGLLRVFNYLSFALSSAILGPWLIKRPHVVFVYHPPLTIGLPAYVLSRFWHVPFVYQIQDMWPETLRATGMLQNPGLLRLVSRFAQWIYKKAQIILVISPGFRRNLIEKGVSSRKIRVISNWIDPNIYYPQDPDPKLAEKLGLDKRFNIIYAGNMGEGQGLETVLESAILLSDLPEVQFVFIGDGIALPRLRQFVEERKIDNIRFLGRYPYHAMQDLYALADVLLIHLKDDPLFRITIPSKTLAYMATGKPILAAGNGDISDLITKVGAGITCPPGNGRALAASVRQLFSMSADERRNMGKQGRQAASNQYSKDVVIAEIEKELRRAASVGN
jgi:glycosyltransferase involved in cell wall biosynthesis